MADDATQEKISIDVPAVTGEEAAEAIDLVEHLVEKYGITPVDADAIFNGMVAIYIRQRAVHGDRQPSYCPFGTSCEPEDKN
jgi:hypothetical protein